MLERTLTLPSTLVVTTLACAADDGGTDASSSGSGELTSTSVTADASTSTSSSDSSGSSGSGEPLPDCAAQEAEAACIGVDGCRWIFNLGCVLECDRIASQSACEMQFDCQWNGTACELPDTMGTI